MTPPVFAAVGLGPAEIAVIAAAVTGGGGLVVLALILVPLQAYRRGHGFWSWFVMQILALNPLYPMMLISLLPNKAKMRRREKYAAELDEKLVASGYTGPVAETLSANIERSLGELPTVDPIARSIGDLPTRGVLRSLGDLPTQDPPDR
jgi:hypothetical protein